MGQSVQEIVQGYSEAKSRLWPSKPTVVKREYLNQIRKAQKQRELEKKRYDARTKGGQKDFLNSIKLFTSDDFTDLGPDQVIDKIAKRYKIHRNILLSKAVKDAITHACRCECYYWLKEKFGYSDGSLGELFGSRCHSLVANGRMRHKIRMDKVLTKGQ